MKNCATAEAKSRAVCAWIKDAIDGTDKPIIIFCYHQIMMDAIEETLECDYMRIDGKTSSEIRAQNVNRFQTDKRCKVVLLSIMAAGTGITLTRSSQVIFAEMYYVPGVLLQAEDRAHRI